MQQIREQIEAWTTSRTCARAAFTLDLAYIPTLLDFYIEAGIWDEDWVTNELGFNNFVDPIMRDFLFEEQWANISCTLI